MGYYHYAAGFGLFGPIRDHQAPLGAIGSGSEEGTATVTVTYFGNDKYESSTTNVTVTVNGKKTEASEGVRLSELIHGDKPCGGHGICGKCKVILEGNEVLACQTLIDRDLTVLTAKEELLFVKPLVKVNLIFDKRCINCNDTLPS